MRYGDSYYKKEEGKPSVAVIGCILLVIFFALYLLVPATVGIYNKPQKENITFATNLPFAPFEDMIGGEFVGLDIDIAYLYGDKYNNRVMILDVPEFDDVFRAVDSGKADMAISAITINSNDPKRDSLVDFSIGYFNASQAVLVMEGGKFKIVQEITPENFRGMKVGYQAGTTSESWAAANLAGKIDLADNMSFGNMDSGLQLLRRGDFDGIIMDEPAARSYAARFPDMKIGGVIDTKEQYGIAVKKGDPKKLLPKVNALIEEIRQNGKYDELIKKHFGGEEK